MEHSTEKNKDNRDASAPFKADHSTLVKTLGRNVQSYRRKAGYDQQDLADRIGVNRNYISLVESGKKYPTLKVLFDMAEILKTTPTDLLKNDGVLDALKELTNKYNLDELLKGVEKLKEQ